MKRKSDTLFGFQRRIVDWAVQKQRAAIFADTGLGKSRILLAWLDEVLVGERMGLVVTPLSAARQIVDEAREMNLASIVEKRDMMPRDSDLEDPKFEGRPLIAVTNYERLKSFDLSKFAAVVLDESCMLKDSDLATTKLILEGISNVKFRLSLTATPSPDDVDEMTSQSAVLGYGTRKEIIEKYMEMRKRRWTAVEPDAFYGFVCSWSCWVRKPSDVGCPDDDAKYELPGIEYTPVQVPSPGKTTKPGKRAAQKDGMMGRIKAVCDITDQDDSHAVVWCVGNDESALLAARIEGAVEMRGEYGVKKKEAILTAFTKGEPYNGNLIRVLVTKCSMCGLGINLQRVHRQIFCTVTDNATAFYQSVRRSYRFGQKHKVDVFVISSEAEGDVLQGLRDKQAAMDESWSQITTKMKELWAAKDV